MCVGLLGTICQLAYNQGDDFFAYRDNMFLKACEYAACFNYTNDGVPYTLYTWNQQNAWGGISPVEQPELGTTGRGNLRPIWALPYYHYAKVKNIEAMCMLDIANRIITPAVIKYSKVVADEIIAKKAVNPDLSAETEEKLLERLSDCLHEMGLQTHALHMLHEEAYDKETWPERAAAYVELVVPAMDNLRAVADRLEELTDRAYWPLPTYNDMLFYV